MKKIKLFLSDIDGTLTDGGMYYNGDGEFLKKFNTRDGHGFSLLKKNKILTGVVTSENSIINERRFKDKLHLDFVLQNKTGDGKLKAVNEIISNLGIDICEVAYIGYDVNCLNLLTKVGVGACPSDSNSKIIDIPNIIKLKNKGGFGCVREFIEIILNNRC